MRPSTESAAQLQRLPLWHAFGWLILVVSLYLFVQPNGGMGRDWLAWLAVFGPVDKVLHVLVFFGYGAWFGAVAGHGKLLRIACALLLWAIFIELLQGALPTGRAAEAQDVVADAVGLVFGLIAARLFARRWLLRIDRWLTDVA
jgi:VanZ like family